MHSTSLNRCEMNLVLMTIIVVYPHWDEQESRCESPTSYFKGWSESEAEREEQLPRFKSSPSTLILI